MPGGASKLRDVRKLSDAAAILDLDIPVAELRGLSVEPLAGGGPVHAHLQFGREQGYMVAKVALTGQVELVCQRCMGPMRWSVDAKSTVLLIESETEANGAPVEWETYIAPDGRASVAGLAAEELLLALPIVPLHEGGSECANFVGREDVGSSATRAAAEPSAAAEPVTTRPFADLRALLERGAKPKN
jgi:uncharacterized protein